MASKSRAWRALRSPESALAPAAPAVAAAPGGVAPTDAVSVNRFWLWLSLFLACGWGLSAVYWWLAARGPAGAAPAAAENPPLREARRALQRACEADDASAARAALLIWGQALLAPRDIANLHRLCAELGADLTAAVERLNACLYASAEDDWRGADLLSLCRRLEAEYGAKPTPSGERLQPLNPPPESAGGG